MDQVRDSSRSLQLLSELLFNPALTRLSEGVLDEGVFHEDRGPVAIGARASVRLQEMLESLEHQDLEQLRDLAMTNHVIMRAFRPLAQLLEDAGKELDADWVRVALEQESFRINHALGFLRDICAALEEKGCPAVVIKSLDHWPDLGSDLDLFTDADAADVVNVFRSEFKAELDNRSWGDRLANKWNFIVPGLPELVEVHVGRLGQTGEQIALTRSLCARTRTTNIAGHVFRVPAPEDRLVISTLQRMYRHFYIRICDVLDNARLLDNGQVDFAYLHSLGAEAGLWDGIATYMRIISEYVESYRGFGVPLPSLVTGSARFGASQVRFRRQFLRVPILPHSLHLYAGELKTLLFRGELKNSLRLSLLPGLATAAAIEQKITGSDKGIW